MAQKQDKDDGSAGKPKPPVPPAPSTPPSGREGAPPKKAPPESFLPEDSFLLDVEDEGGHPSTPAAEPNVGSQGSSPGSSEEWLLVDDEELAGVTPAPAEPLPAAEPVAAAPEPVASEKKVPSWYTDDEGALPKFVAEGDESAAAASVASTPATEEAPAEPVESDAEAPVHSLASARRRRMLVAAAGLLALVGIGGAVWFQMNRGGEAGPTEVASRPAPTVKPTPKPEPVVVAPEPTPEPEPVAPTVAAPPVEPEPVLPKPEVAPAPANPVVLDEPRKRPLPQPGSARAAQPKKGDTIVQLKNGHTFRGQITRTKGTLVSLRIGLGECVFDLGDVTLLDSSAPEYRRADQMPEASVILATGQRLRGRLMKQTEDNLVLVVDNGQVVFPRADIKDVSFTGRIHF